MKVLGIGDSCDLGAMYMRLGEEGHDVRVVVREREAHEIMRGLVHRAEDWRDQLAWVGRDGIILFEGVGDGVWQDELRAAGYQVIGGSAYGDRLEMDRPFGQAVLREIGLPTAPVYRFHDFAAGIAHLERARRRVVVKLNGNGFASWRNYVGQVDDGSDVVAYLQAAARRWSFPEAPDFILMDHVAGVETGVGAYFNGERFLLPACLDWEHKRFFTGDLGELTGEMGTLVTYTDTQSFFERTLGKLEGRLREHGHVGYVNLNTMVNEDGIWPLELTSRFGYPGSAILHTLQGGGWGQVLQRMASRERAVFDVAPGFAVGVVLTVPPFPYRYGFDEVSRGSPVLLGLLSEGEKRRLHLGELGRDDYGDLVTAGGCVAVATGAGATAAAAKAEAYALAKKVVCPSLRYRTDIADRFIAYEQALLEGWGYLRTTTAAMRSTLA